MITVSDFVGFVGTGLIIAAYLMLQTKRMSSEQVSYSVMNLVGALCILYSLIFNFNMSAFLVELFWVGISLVGIVRWARGTRRAPLR